MMLEQDSGGPLSPELASTLARSLAVASEDALTALLWLDLGGMAGARAAQVVVQVKQWLREQDACEAIDGRHVVFMLPQLQSEGQAVLAAHRVLDELNRFERTPLLFLPKVGIALGPRHARSPGTLVESAEAAAAQISGSGVAMYDARHDYDKQLVQRLGGPLREALADNALHLAYQPMVDLNSGCCAGAEALLRWQDASLGWVPPYEIVIVAERLHLHNELTRFVLNTGFREIAMLNGRGYRGTISLNLGANDLMDSGLPDIIADGLAIWNLPPAQVMFELTESAAVSDIDATIETLQRLQSLGCRVALDDFGTGYSSLTHLLRLPINKLKIDRSFIQDLKAGTRESHIVESVIDLAHKLGMTVVAEGVEELATVDILQAMRCDQIQGYYFGRPGDAEALLRFALQFGSEPI
ncbi:EAL domain-containing protein [Burkholderiaceae bacterium DAT-1]|nr:EAL domain-containing protein [Burkholderiaceae bacterium DAT-1]